MNLGQIDQLLSDWKKKIDLVSQNLLELQSLPSYQRLSGAYGFPKVKLTGITEKRVTPAINAMNELFQYFELLILTINQASEIRKDINPFLGSDKKIQEIEYLLLNASIQLPTVPTPLAQRGLLSAAEVTHRITPNQLLGAMTSTFEIAKDAVLEVDGAWLSLEPTLGDADMEIRKLESLAQSLGQSSLSDLLLARQKISLLRNLIETDPLGVSNNFGQEISPLITRSKIALEGLLQQHQTIKEKCAIASSLLQKLIQVHEDTKKAFADCQEKVLEHSYLQPPLPDAEIEALSQWLKRLESKLSEGLLMPIGVGLDKLIANANAYLTREQNNYTTNKAPLDLRQELRGRLDVLQAKALGRGMAENVTLSELAEKAKKLLYSRPTPLNEATDLISQYEKYLNRK
jgi:hypothetical protein